VRRGKDVQESAQVQHVCPSGETINGMIDVDLKPLRAQPLVVF
jgi:hypothetical protein